jgi:hypothetical protein
MNRSSIRRTHRQVVGNVIVMWTGILWQLTEEGEFNFATTLQIVMLVDIPTHEVGSPYFFVLIPMLLLASVAYLVVSVAACDTVVFLCDTNNHGGLLR